jgi:hypothetical protein
MMTRRRGRYCARFLLPRERPTRLPGLPVVRDVESARQALTAIIAAAGSGKLSPAEAESLSRTIVTYLKLEPAAGEMRPAMEVESGFVTWKSRLLGQTQVPDVAAEDVLEQE